MTTTPAPDTATAVVNLFDTWAIANILADHYPVRHICTGWITLETPAASRNAAEWLRRHGIDAPALWLGCWMVQV